MNQRESADLILFTNSALGFLATVQILKGFAEVQDDEGNL